jgi:disulfide oxidoreductase YuzD
VCCFNYSDNKHSLTHHSFYLFAHNTICSSCVNVPTYVGTTRTDDIMCK